MPRYRVQVNHSGLFAGETVDIPEHEVDAWAGEIELGFLVPAYEPVAIPTPAGEPWGADDPDVDVAADAG